jgi:CTP:molybdopterin cytidylyltransferase MocA
VIAAIVPAAGRSRRMGDGVQKLLLPLAGKAMVAHVVDQLLSALELVVVVTRPGDAAIAAALAGRPVTYAVNPDLDGDMLSSIRTGLRAIPASCTGILVAPADHPHVPATLVRRLIEAFAAAPDRIIVPVHDSRRGHPVIFPVAMRDEVLAQFDGEGLRGLLLAHPAAVVEVKVESPAVVQDIDQPADYERASMVPSSGTPGEG